MDGLDPGLIAAIVTVAGLGGTVAFAVFAVRRARALRQRQIDSAGEARPAPTRSRKGRLVAKELEEEEGEEEREEEPEERETEEIAARPAAEKRQDERAGRVLPFPAPTPAPTPSVPPAAKSLPAAAAPPVVMPVDKPAPAEPKLKKREPGALAPGLARTRSGWVSRLGQVFSGKKTLDPALVEDIEKVLLSADIGVRTSQKLLDDIRSSIQKRDVADPEAVWALLRRRSIEMLTVETAPVNFAAASPFVLLVIGVNGSGKTTTIGKVASKLRAEGKSVLLAAGDTFRAAATEQLEIWGSRVGSPVVRGREGADPSSVLFDAVKRAVNERFDVVIADTAGRLHTKTNLMDELQKIRRVIGKAHEGAPHETWLVIDSTNGQNAIAQAQVFTQAMAVSGIVLTKLDGTAKGGVILGIADQLQIPVRYIGVGERVADLHEFDPEEFVQALFDAAPSPGAAA